MKNPLPVTLDDLQATAMDDKYNETTYRKINIRFRYGVFWYFHDGFACSEEFAKAKLVEYGKRKQSR